MSKKITLEELSKIIHSRMEEHYKSLKSEGYFDNEDEEENLGMFSGGFNKDEFEDGAQKAAMSDIGSEFVPLGKSEFEKGMDPEEFKSDLQRQNLNLPSDKQALGKIKKAVNINPAKHSIQKQEKLFGKGSINESVDKNFEMALAQQMFTGLSQESYVPEKDKSHLSNIAIKRMMTDGLLEYDSDVDHDDNGQAIGAENYYWFNDRGRLEVKSPQDIIDDYFYSDDNDNYGEKEKAYFRGSEGNGGMDEGSVNPDSKIDRPKDSNGQPITLRARVIDLPTKSVGRVLRFGIDDNGKQTVHVEWIQNFGAAIPKTITYPEKIVVEDPNRIVKEEEIDENMGLSHTIGQGQNLKPSNYPETLTRGGMNENFASNEVDYYNKQDINQYAGKKISVKNMNDIHELIDLNPKRIESIFKDLHEELNNNHVQNNIVVASDYMDTQWIFDVLGEDNETVYLEFTGTAK